MTVPTVYRSEVPSCCRERPWFVLFLRQLDCSEATDVSVQNGPEAIREFAKAGGITKCHLADAEFQGRDKVTSNLLLPAVREQHGIRALSSELKHRHDTRHGRSIVTTCAGLEQLLHTNYFTIANCHSVYDRTTIRSRPVSLPATTPSLYCFHLR